MSALGGFFVMLGLGAAGYFIYLAARDFDIFAEDQVIGRPAEPQAGQQQQPRKQQRSGGRLTRWKV